MLLDYFFPLLLSNNLEFIISHVISITCFIWCIYVVSCFLVINYLNVFYLLYIEALRKGFFLYCCFIHDRYLSTSLHFSFGETSGVCITIHLYFWSLNYFYKCSFVISWCYLISVILPWIIFILLWVFLVPGVYPGQVLSKASCLGLG